MEVIDYNGEGRWTREAILRRYMRYAADAGISPFDLSPMEHVERGRRWVYPAMEKVIEGIQAGDVACIRLGVEFIEEDARFAFGATLKSNTARALRRADLTEDLRGRIRARVLLMLRAGQVPREFRDYAKLARKIGLDATALADVPGTSKRVTHFKNYLEAAARRR